MNWQEDEFPLASVVLNLTVDVPVLRTVPLTGPEMIFVTGPAQLSVVVGFEYVTVAEQSPGEVETVR